MRRNRFLLALLAGIAAAALIAADRSTCAQSLFDEAAMDEAAPLTPYPEIDDVRPFDAGGEYVEGEYVEGGVVGECCRGCRLGRCCGRCDCCRAYGPNYYPDLFYNYYVYRNNCGYPVQLYVAPLPVPPHVGHTYITYQPLMPDNFLYPHHRTYKNHWGPGEWTRTQVSWNTSPLTNTFQGARSLLRLPR